MAWYTVANNSTGLLAFLHNLNDGMASQLPGIGGNFVGISILIPLWVIIFLPLARFNAGNAMIVASFVCWIVTVFLMAIQMVNEIAFVIFTLLLVASAAIQYLNTRN
jgi:hypothetical protein